MVVNIQNISNDVIADMREEALRRGFRPASEKPGYDLIGKKGHVILLERATEELVVLNAKVANRNGRPWVKTYFPKDREYWQYIYLGWSV